jgi:acyl phosphate:glycerol-3-phosphate acyltransferase
MAINPLLAAGHAAELCHHPVLFRYVSLASIVAAAFAPFYQALIWGVEPQLLALVVMCLLLVWRHEGNIRKLLAGTENKFGQKAAGAGPAAGAQQPHRHHKTH